MKTSATRASRGFTLVELAIVIITLTVLSAVVSPPLVGFVQKTRFDGTAEEFRTLENSLIHYYSDTGSLRPLENIAGIGTSATDPAHVHLISGDGHEGWDGPYLEELRAKSAHGGTYDIDVLSDSQAKIILGTREELGGTYPALLETVNKLLDGDKDLDRGVIWGDANGINYGVNYSQP